MAVIHDSEFGDITVRRSAQAKSVRIKVAPNGTFRASMPMYTPMFALKRMISSSRAELRKLRADSMPKTDYYDGMQIGKSHFLSVVQSSSTQIKTEKKKQRLTIYVPMTMSENDPMVIDAIRKLVIQALRAEAKSYLPKRLQYLASIHGFTYEKVRFSHAGSRWGSCSSKGTISLNIALMKLPFELIDYVLVHELAHTKQMNHSPEFWHIVEMIDPDYRTHRKALKEMTPSI
jgi:predicted metal-dependent hydrolase